MMPFMLNSVFDKDEDGVAVTKGVPSLRPRDAATLILVRRDQAQPRVLMGKRAAADRRDWMEAKGNLVEADV